MILAILAVGGLALGGVAYLAMKGKLASVEASLKAPMSAAVKSLEAAGSKVEAEAKADMASVAAFLKSKL